MKGKYDISDLPEDEQKTVFRWYRSGYRDGWDARENCDCYNDSPPASRFGSMLQEMIDADIHQSDEEMLDAEYQEESPYERLIRQGYD